MDKQDECCSENFTSRRCDKDYALKHRIASGLWATGDVFDPFQVFEVCNTNCNRIRVHVLYGKNITKGALSDFIDTPDPYLILSVPGTPNGLKRTRDVENCCNPKWDNVFYFFINPEIHNDLSVVLMDANDILADGKLGQVTIGLDDLKLNVESDVTIMFKKGSKVHMKMLKEKNSRPDLRFSLALSDEEKKFLQKRRTHVLQGMTNFLGEEVCPKIEKEVPCVAVLGSGGGIRALIGYSGACKALEELKVLDCVMFIASLSGSSWFLSCLYSQPDLPHKDPKEVQAELRKLFEMNPLKLLDPSLLYNSIKDMVKKSVSGQPVSLTDLFGHLLGHLLLKEKKNLKLSDQRKLLVDGQAPLPLYTCINVKKNVSARVFQEWVEFSPFEIGIAKYGTFTKPENWGSKFFLGNMIRKFEEPPLHFLQGIWGSAYSIQFKRFVKEFCGAKECVDEIEDDDTVESYTPEYDKSPALDKMNNDSGSSESEVESHDSDYSDSEDVPITQKMITFLAMERNYEERSRKMLSCADGEREAPNRGKHTNSWKQKKKEKRRGKQCVQKSVWLSAIEGVLENKITNSRVLRAGIVYNILRGLQVQNTFPLPDIIRTESYDEDEFKGQFEPTEMETKMMFMVDSGLTFNLPFPLLLRPQRAVDLYLCYEFSIRETDEDAPFDELLLAEKWARLNKVPFPPIEQQVKKYKKEPLRECYVFEDLQDMYCPIVLFFPLVNNHFRHFKAPGVKRETEEEKRFGEFHVFNDPKKPFGTFKFQYSGEEFDRLAGLVEFNTLFSEPLIRNYMEKAVNRKRDLLPRPLISATDDYKHLKLKSNKHMEELKMYMKVVSTLGNLQPAKQEQVPS